MKKTVSIILTASLLTAGLAACKKDGPIETVTCPAEDSSVVTESTATEPVLETSGSDVEPTEALSSDEWIFPDSTEVTNELNDVFTDAVDDLIGVGYTPRLYLGYLESGGTMHCFLCESMVIVPDAVPYWSLVYVFEDADGNCAVIGMYVPSYSASDTFVAAQDLPTDMVPGGWGCVMDQDVDLDSLIQDSFPGTDLYNVSLYTGKMLLASQVVAGTNYAILCETEGEAAGEKMWTVVYVYEDLQGNRSLLNISALDLGSIYGPLVWNGPGEDYRDVCRAYLEENDA